jgi:hypothetical protein
MRYTPSETRDWKFGLWQSRQRSRKVMDTRDPMEIHGTHSAEVRGVSGRYSLWCRDCRCDIIELSDQDYAAYKEAFPSIPRRVKKS